MVMLDAAAMAAAGVVIPEGKKHSPRPQNPGFIVIHDSELQTRVNTRMQMHCMTAWYAKRS